jgi:hypothetical protein
MNKLSQEKKQGFNLFAKIMSLRAFNILYINKIHSTFVALKQFSKLLIVILNS